MYCQISASVQLHLCLFPGVHLGDPPGRHRAQILGKTQRVRRLLGFGAEHLQYFPVSGPERTAVLSGGMQEGACGLSGEICQVPQGGKTSGRAEKKPVPAGSKSAVRHFLPEKNPVLTDEKGGISGAVCKKSPAGMTGPAFGRNRRNRNG